MLGRFYALAAQHVDDPPVKMQCRVGPGHSAEKPGSVTAVWQDNEFKALVDARRPVILVETGKAAKGLVDRWGLCRAEQSVRTQIAHVAGGPAVPLLDMFPALRWQKNAEQAQRIELVVCEELRLETLTDEGKTSEPKSLWQEGDVVYWSETLGHDGLLEELDRHLGLGLDSETFRKILDHRANQQRREHVSRIRSEEDAPAKLLAAVGADGIRPRLPAGLVQSVEAAHGPLDGRLLAELAMVVYGVDLLQTFKEELERAGLEPPQRWAGSSRARRFVRELGFDRPYAGYEQSRRAPLLNVDGPSVLPKLHDFQRGIRDRIRDLLRGSEDERRGLLSLPTGAGKTRIAVQAMVESHKEGDLEGAILWIAQSDELCEQAVQTWREVWRSEGVTDRQMHVSRLWAQNQAEPQDEGLQVVVATVQKLQNCIEDPVYDWLKEASVVLVDEAHGVIAPVYRKVLGWQGIGRNKTRCPFVGLTATPFRGKSVPETARLVRMFGGNRLDSGLGEDPYRFLQDRKVLSEVEHNRLTGSSVTLSSKELDELRKLHSIPSSVYDRLAADVARNNVLLSHICELPRDWPALLFAASVEHAQIMAALLKLKDISAAPISAETAPGARRQYIDAFRAGEIQVLTNYGVLTQGFDAPAVRAIYVARPTFSPNLYQQMIGRGLRGPLNGGKDTCLIVNIEDNFSQYGEQLAFLDFEGLWDKND